jgi:hypothetical protein
MRISTFYRNKPLLFWLDSPLHLFSLSSKVGFGRQLPTFKFDMISTGSRQIEASQNWDDRMPTDYYRVEKSITRSIARAIKSENSEEKPMRHGGADYGGGGRRPPSDSSGGEDGNGAHPARATLIIEIGKPRSY